MKLYYVIFSLYGSMLYGPTNQCALHAPTTHFVLGATCSTLLTLNTV